MKSSFIRTYFENKKGEALRKTITPNWDSTNAHLTLLNIDPNIDSICEVGCGIGRLLKELNLKIPICVGFDASQSMIDEGKIYCEGTSVDLIKCEGQGLLPHASNFFDHAFSFITFQHIPNTNTVILYISEMHRILKKGGTIKVQLLKNDEFPDRDLWSYHDESLLKSEMQKIGFSEIDQIDFGRWIFLTGKK